MKLEKSSAGKMSKRIYDENKRLFRYKVGGNYYTRIGDTELCLETSDIAVAATNLAYQDTLTTRYGAAAYKFKVRDMFPKFLAAKKKELRSSTFQSYEKLWKSYMEKSLGKLYLADVDQKAWDKYCDAHDSVADFQNHKNLVHSFLVWCAQKRHIGSISVLKNPSHKRRRRKIIPPTHLALIFQRAHGSLLLFCSMALFMGMRRTEIITLEWLRADLVGKSITLRDEDVKTDDGRHIPMNSTVYSLLVERLSEQQDAKVKTKWVFPNAASSKRHASPSGLMTAWRWCLLDCGLAEKVPTKGKKSKYKIVVQYTWHDLRATYEKYSHLAQGFTDTQREKMVGADIDVQKRLYVSMGPDDLRGMEEVVTKQLPELSQIIDRKTVAQKVEAGMAVGNKKLSKSESDATSG